MGSGLFWGVFGGLKLWGDYLNNAIGLGPALGIKAELDYIKRKIDAGADGFFTQPFFDLRLMEIYYDLLPKVETFWGISPVMSARSKDYWDNLNNAIFPPDFEPTLEWNRTFAKRALEFCRNTDSNIYFMPIRVDLVKYLEGIL